MIFSACFNDTARKKYQLIRPDSSLLARLKQHGAYMAQVKAEQHFGSPDPAVCLPAGVSGIPQPRVFRHARTPSGMTLRKMKRSIRSVTYINDNLTENLSLDRLASTFYISKYYLSNQFRQYTGLTLLSVHYEKTPDRRTQYAARRHPGH